MLSCILSFACISCILHILLLKLQRINFQLFETLFKLLVIRISIVLRSLYWLLYLHLFGQITSWVYLNCGIIFGLYLCGIVLGLGLFKKLSILIKSSLLVRLLFDLSEFIFWKGLLGINFFIILLFLIWDLSKISCGRFCKLFKLW